jgi:hypothetical protein
MIRGFISSEDLRIKALKVNLPIRYYLASKK